MIKLNANYIYGLIKILTRYYRSGQKNLPLKKENFYKPYLDQRTKNTITYNSYKGVCLVRCGTVAIQRKLVYIAKQFCASVSVKS